MNKNDMVSAPKQIIFNSGISKLQPAGYSWPASLFDKQSFIRTLLPWSLPYGLQLLGSSLPGWEQVEGGEHQSSRGTHSICIYYPALYSLLTHMLVAVTEAAAFCLWVYKILSNKQREMLISCDDPNFVIYNIGRMTVLLWGLNERRHRKLLGRKKGQTHTHTLQHFFIPIITAITMAGARGGTASSHRPLKHSFSLWSEVQEWSFDQWDMGPK